MIQLQPMKSEGCISGNTRYTGLLPSFHLEWQGNVWRCSHHSTATGDMADDDNGDEDGQMVEVLQGIDLGI